MTITIPDEIEKAALELSSRSGTTTDRLILKALQDYFLPAKATLQEEFDAWELASDQDIAGFDYELNPDAIGPR